MSLRTVLLSLLSLFLMTGCPGTPGGDDDDSDGADDDDSADVCEGDDSMEENDDASEAIAVSDGDSFQDLYVCIGDVDYFEFTAPSDGEITAEILFLHDEGDIDLHFEADDGSNISNASSSNDNEALSLFLTSGDTIYIQVEAEFRDDDVPGNEYDISFTFM